MTGIEGTDSGPGAEVPVEQSVEVIYSSRWMDVREETLRWPSGRVDVYPTVRRRDFALIVPWEDGGFWIVEQYRYPVRERRWEFPQGGWPDDREHTPVELAARELSEETGLTAARWQHLGRLSAASSFTAQVLDAYLASELRYGEPNLEETEADMRRRWVSDADLAQMIREGQFSEAASVAAYGLFLVQGWLRT